MVVDICNRRLTVEMTQTYMKLLSKKTVFDYKVQRDLTLVPSFDILPD